MSTVQYFGILGGWEFFCFHLIAIVHCLQISYSYLKCTSGGGQQTVSITDVLSKPEAASRKRRRTKDEPEVSLKQEMNAMKPEDLGGYDVSNNVLFMLISWKS